METVEKNGRTVARFGVRKRDAKKNPKMISDKKTECLLERMTARDEHKCVNPLCSYFMNVIEKGTTYAVVTDHRREGGIRLRGRVIPPTFKYHFDCLPDDYKGMGEFING